MKKKLVPLQTARKPPQHSHKMQSSEKQGARAKTPTKDSPRHFIISIEDDTYNTVTVNQEDYDILTQGPPSTRTATPKTPSAPRAVNHHPQHTRRLYAGTVTGITFFSEQNLQSTPQSSQSMENDELKGKTEVPWTPKQSYDNKGNPDYQMNSDGIVLTSPSGHPFCSYCRIPSHSRRSCHIRIEDMAQNIDRPFHPSRGTVKSKNEKARHNKFPNELPPAKHEIPGTSKIRAESTYADIPNTSKHSHFRPPKNPQKFIDDTDIRGIPNFWTSKGSLVISQQGHARCNYCGIPSHPRSKCNIKAQDESNGQYHTIHPNRGDILSNNQAAKKLQSDDGACYKTFKEHLRYSKNRIQIAKTRSLQTSHKTGEWDYNQNHHLSHQAHPTKESQNRNLKRPAENTTPKKLVKYRAKWEDDTTITDVPQLNKVNIMDMPAEIVEKIIQYLPFKQRTLIQRTNHRIKNITLNSVLWQQITIPNSRLTTTLMKRILRERPSLLDLPGCTWNLTPQEEIVIENYLILYKPRLTYLGLQSYRGINSIIATTIFLAKNLTTLDLSESSFGLLSCIMDRLDKTNVITALNLSIMKRPPLRRMRPMGDPSELGEMYSPIRASTMAILTVKCTKLTDLNLCGARLSQEAITLICNQITPTLVAINLAREYVKDGHVGALITRCRNMRYINLAETKISYGIIHLLAVGWRYSMRDLTLPEQLARQLKLFSSFGPYARREEFATLIKSMPRLERLHVGHYRFEQSDIMARRDHVIVLCEMFPHLLINPSPFGKLGPSSYDPARKFHNAIRPQSWALRY